MIKKYLFKALCLISCLALCAALASCSGKKDDKESQGSQPSEVEETVSELIKDFLSNSPELMEIKTDYVNLLYPERWKDSLRTNIVKGNPYKVEMFATIGNHDEVHLFDIFFGGDEGICVGGVDVNGETIEVNLLSYDVDTHDGWSEDDGLILLTMQEDINYTIEALNR